jgi:hypothetical protein
VASSPSGRTDVEATYGEAGQAKTADAARGHPIREKAACNAWAVQQV